MTTPSPDPATIAVRRREDALVFIGGIVDNAVHAHLALQIAISRVEPVRLVLSDREIEGPAVIVAGGVAHGLHLADGAVHLLEPESRTARALRDRFLGPDRAVRLVTAPPLTEDGGDLEGLLGGEPLRERQMDPRIASIRAWLDELEAMGRWPEVSLAGALERTHLSEGRFRHLFAEEVGSSWTRYLVWRRALVAATHAFEGATLTEAAHAAGYADSAHLSRQFKALFGFTPSRAIGFSRYVQG